MGDNQKNFAVLSEFASRELAANTVLGSLNAGVKQHVLPAPLPEPVAAQAKPPLDPNRPPANSTIVTVTTTTTTTTTSHPALKITPSTNVTEENEKQKKDSST